MQYQASASDYYVQDTEPDVSWGRPNQGMALWEIIFSTEPFLDGKIFLALMRITG